MRDEFYWHAEQLLIKGQDLSVNNDMEDLTQALEGLPGFVGQLDLHQHSYDQISRRD